MPRAGDQVQSTASKKLSDPNGLLSFIIAGKETGLEARLRRDRRGSANPEDQLVIYFTAALHREISGKKETTALSKAL